MKPVYCSKNKKGERNVFCSHYDRCLDYAVDRSWMDFDCSCCRNFLNKGARGSLIFTSNDATEVYSLPNRIDGEVYWQHSTYLE